MQDLQWLEGGITAVPGILASGVAAGIKPSGKKDLALIYSSSPARAAAVFTRNQVKGAPVLVSQEHVRDGRAQAIVASSGCSNVCTGEQGIKDAREMTRIVGELLHVPPKQVLIAVDRRDRPGPADGQDPRGAAQAGEGAVAPGRPERGGGDPHHRHVRQGSGAAPRGRRAAPSRSAGIAKGVGMLEPHLATMFCFLATDAMVAADALAAVLRRGGGRLVQPRHRRRRPVDERHGGGARQWPRRERHARARGQGAAAVRPRARRR